MWTLWTIYEPYLLYHYQAAKRCDISSDHKSTKKLSSGPIIQYFRVKNAIFHCFATKEGKLFTTLTVPRTKLLSKMEKKNTVTNPKYAVPNIKNTILIIIIIRVASNCEVGILELYPSISNNASLHLESILCGRWWLPQRTLHSMPSTGVVTPADRNTHTNIFPHNFDWQMFSSMREG